MSMTRDEFTEAVKAIDVKNNQRLSEADYVEACQELADYFHTNAEATQCDMEGEDDG